MMMMTMMMMKFADADGDKTRRRRRRQQCHQRRRRRRCCNPPGGTALADSIVQAQSSFTGLCLRGLPSPKGENPIGVTQASHPPVGREAHMHFPHMSSPGRMQTARATLI